MDLLSSTQLANYQTIALVITPYHINGISTSTYPGSLLQILREIVSHHSIPGTPYQNAFYQDLSNPSLFYHLQTSPPEPSCGWSTNLSSTNSSSPASSPPSPSSDVTIPDDTASTNHLSLHSLLANLYAYATPTSSDGLIALGLPPRSRWAVPPFHEIAFNAPLLLIGTRDIDVSSSSGIEQLQCENEMQQQLALFRPLTGIFPVAAGWRANGYVAAGGTHTDSVDHGKVERRCTGTRSKEQFVTLTGWNSVEDYMRVTRMLVVGAKRGASISKYMLGTAAGGDVDKVPEAGMLSPDVVGEGKVWGRRIA